MRRYLQIQCAVDTFTPEYQQIKAWFELRREEMRSELAHEGISEREADAIRGRLGEIDDFLQLEVDQQAVRNRTAPPAVIEDHTLVDYLDQQ